MFDVFDNDWLLEARIDAVEEAYEAGILPLEPVSQRIESAEIDGIVIGEELPVKLLFLIELLLPEKIVVLLCAL